MDSTASAVVQFVKARAIVRGSAASLAQGVLRSMFITRWLKVALVLLVAGATASGVELLVQEGSAGVKAPAPENPRAARIDDRPVQEVKPGKIRFDVIERGSLEPSRARDAYCLVEGPTTIISIRPDGSQVIKGDLVCELDSAPLKDTTVYQHITTKSAERAYQQAKLASEIAGIAVTDYVEAILKLERRTLETTITSAQTAVRKANVRLEQTRSARRRVKDALATKAGTATPADIVAELDIEDRLAVAQQTLNRERMALEEANGKLELFENTAKETTEERKQELVRKRSAEQVKLSIWETQKSKEANLHKQIENCRFYASIDGRIILANDPRRNFGNSQPAIEGGATVRERQKIFSLMPLNDPMQVNVKVHESKVAQVKLGMKARVRVDAFADRTLSGTVKDVAPLPDPSSIFSSDIKVYTIHVTIDEPRSGLRPGLTAQVEIFGDERDNVLTVPVKAVLHFDGKDHVAVKKPEGGFDWREVTLGLSDETIVEIKQGLKSGDVVALDPLALMSEKEKRQKFGSAPIEKEKSRSARPSATPWAVRRVKAENHTHEDRQERRCPQRASDALQRGNRPGPDGRPTPGAVRDRPRRGRRAGLRRPGRAARTDGPARLPGRAGRPARHAGCIPSHLPGFGQESTGALGAGFLGSLAPSSGLPDGVVCPKIGSPTSPARTECSGVGQGNSFRGGRRAGAGAPRGD